MRTSRRENGKVKECDELPHVSLSGFLTGPLSQTQNETAIDRTLP